MADLSLSTHVLDLSCGLPGRGIQVLLYRVVEQTRIPICSVITNHDGRTDAPLIKAGEGEPGVYELIFQVGPYFRAQGQQLPDPAFLDEIVIRFGLTEGGGHFHVPLLVSPYGYSTYRGS